jgi:antitoxin CptB
LDTEARRRMLKFRSCHRGLRELDLYMEAFVASRLDSFTTDQLDQFEAVLDIPDQEALALILGQAEPSDDIRSPVLDLVLGFRYPAPAKVRTD